MSRKVLITGGTGLIGTRLAEMLIDAGYEVALLSRTTGTSHYRSFRWDPQAGTIDEAAIPYADYIINLAGSSVSDGKWTDERKREILTSRLGGTLLMARELAKSQPPRAGLHFGLGHWHLRRPGRPGSERGNACQLPPTIFWPTLPAVGTAAQT